MWVCGCQATAGPRGLAMLRYGQGNPGNEAPGSRGSNRHVPDDENGHTTALAAAYRMDFTGDRDRGGKQREAPREADPTVQVWGVGGGEGGTG